MNKIILLGHLGEDPRVFSGNTNGCSFNLCVNEKINDKEIAQWFTVVSFGNLSTVCSKHLKKGSQVLVEGKAQTREYEKNDTKVKVFEVLAKDVRFL